MPSVPRVIQLWQGDVIRQSPKAPARMNALNSPLIPDAPIIALTLFLAAKVAALRLFLGLVSLAGGVFVLYLSWESFRPVPMQSSPGGEIPKSGLKGVVTNLLSPHPWLFWLTVGAASLAKALAQHWTLAVTFLTGFYALLVGSKVVVGFVAGHSRDLFAGRVYCIVMRVLALLLLLFSLLLFREGFRYLVPAAD